MTASKADLIDLSDEVWDRLRRRVEGLTDDEYLWEPAPGCWTIRQRPDGRWREEHVIPEPEAPPFTTIAWRLWHLIDMYGEDRAPRFLDLPPQGPAIGLDDPDGSAPPTAAEAVALLERAHDRWRRHLSLVKEERLQDAIGPVGENYADRTRAAFVLHMLDEYIHHSAEVALLRDLWHWQRVADNEGLEDRVKRGDRSVLADLADAARRDQAEREHPDLVTTAAAHARWELVTGLAERGLPVGRSGRTALHLAAGAGELEVVQSLVAHGADATVTDPEFHATPVQWAQFFGRDAVVAWLDAQPGQQQAGPPGQEAAGSGAR